MKILMGSLGDSQIEFLCFFFFNESYNVGFNSFPPFSWCHKEVNFKLGLKTRSLGQLRNKCFGYIPWSEIAKSYGSLLLIFWGAPELFHIMTMSLCVPINSVQGFQFLCILASTCCLWCFVLKIATLTIIRW